MGYINLESTPPNPDTKTLIWTRYKLHILVIYFHLKVHVWNLTMLQTHQNLPTNQLQGANKGLSKRFAKFCLELGKSSVYKWVG